MLSSRRCLFAFSSLSIALACSAAAAQTPAALNVFLHDANALQANRRLAAAGDKSLAPAMAKLRKDADKALKAGPFSVMNKKVTPPSGDRHDYYSQAPYVWPNPKDPNGPYITRDGEVNPERAGGDNVPLDKMASAVTTLTAGYFFLGDERYAAHAASLLKTWFLDPNTKMNPNLNFAQAVPGRSSGRGIGIIDTVCFIEMIDGLVMLEGSKDWTPADSKALREWFSQFVTWMQESKNGKDESGGTNNHGVWYDVQLSIYALYAGKTDVAKKVLQKAHERIDRQIEPDGQMPRELARTKSWDYSCYNLTAFCNLALLARHADVDLFAYKSADGRCIAKAGEFLLPYAVDGKEWTHKQIAKIGYGKFARCAIILALNTGQAKFAQAAEKIRGEDVSWPDTLLFAKPKP